MDRSTVQPELVNLEEIRNAALEAYNKLSRRSKNYSKKKQAKIALDVAEENLKKAQATSGLEQSATVHKLPLSAASSILTPCPSEADTHTPEPMSNEEPAPPFVPGANGSRVSVPERASEQGSALTDQIADVRPDIPMPGANVLVGDPIPIDPILLQAPGADAPQPLAGKRKLPLEGLYTIEPRLEDEEDEEEEVEEVEEVPRSKKPKVANTKDPIKEKAPLFSEMTEEAQKKWLDNGRKAIGLFLHERRSIPVQIQGMVRKCREYLPEAATNSPILAQEFLRTGPTTFKCLYHIANRHDIVTDDPVYLTGVPGPVTKDEKKETKPAKEQKPSKEKKSSDKKETKPSKEQKKPSKEKKSSDQNHPGSIVAVFACGCTEEDALFSFFLWKTCTATSKKIGCLKSIYTLGNLGETNIPELPTPRMRSFWHQSIKDFTGIGDLLLFYAYHYDRHGKLVGYPFGSRGYQYKVCGLILGAQRARLDNIGFELVAEPTLKPNELPI